MDEAAENDALQEAPTARLPWVKSPKGIAEIYANSIHITWSLDDIRIRLGQIVDNPETPNPGKDFRGAIEERAAITFTWRNAKLAILDLARAIQNYEKVNGEINLSVQLPPSAP